MDKNLETFWEEVQELLQDLEQSMLELEKNPLDAETVGKVFRIMHTIKGSSSMFGFDDVVGIAHELETLYEQVRSGSIPVDKELIDLSLNARDTIQALVSVAVGLEESAENDTSGLVERIHVLLAPSEEEASPASSSPPLSSPPLPLTERTHGTRRDGERKYRIRFRPPRDAYLRGLDPADIIKELCAFGKCEIKTNSNDIPKLQELDANNCYISWDMVLSTDKSLDQISDVFIFVQDDSEIEINEMVPARETTPKIASAPVQVSRRAEDDHSSTIRVPVNKLDMLVNLVGEVVTVQSSLTQFASEWEDFDMLSNRSDGIYIKPEQVTRLFAVAERMERLVDELRDKSMEIRMVPIGTTFSRFKRVVRDISGDLGKEVQLITEGADTELDKTVIDKLNDPLIHLIRNSMDHGIESPEVREAAGKPRTGTIRLTAEHQGAYVLIHISDDGAGMDVKKIKEKAVAKGLVSDNQNLSDNEALSLIYQPGFSTSDEVTNISGRGVGMDVVRRTIDPLGGSISVQNNPGAGTRITLTLPLTMAIIEGLLVRVGQNRFIFPLSVVEECVELTRVDIEESHGRNLAHVRNETIPYVNLREMFSINGNVPEIQQIVIVRKDGAKMGFVVDEVVGQNQTVIKKLGGLYKNIKNISGASILGDGTVALIMDIHQILNYAIKEEALITGETT